MSYVIFLSKLFSTLDAEGGVRPMTPRQMYREGVVIPFPMPEAWAAKVAKWLTRQAWAHQIARFVGL